MKSFLALLPLLALLSGCAAFGNDTRTWEQPARPTVGVVLKGMDSQHWLDMRSGVNDAARELDVSAVLLYPAEESDAAGQAQMFYDLADRAPDIMLLAPCDSTNVAPLKAYTDERGIPLLTIDTAATDVHLPFIGADNDRIGRMALTRLAGLADKTGSLAVISGVQTQSSHVERLGGFLAALKGYPSLHLVGVYYGDSEFKRGMECMARIMQEHPDVKGVFVTNALMALGAIEELQTGDYESRPYLVAVDTQDDALAALQSGTLQGLVTQNGYEAGYAAVEEAVAVLRSSPAPETRYISTELLTPNTVGAFLQARAQSDRR